MKAIVCYAQKGEKESAGISAYIVTGQPKKEIRGKEAC